METIRDNSVIRKFFSVSLQIFEFRLRTRDDFRINRGNVQ